jgi:mannose-6-phosphate isomerase-like protein (cupin superfamily)
MITTKPWGQEELIEINDTYAVKRLTMKAGRRCSLQFHRLKRETIYVLSGTLRIKHGTTSSLADDEFSSGQSITIEPNVVHRMEGVTDAIYLELSTPHLDDVVRIEDDYGR